MVRVVGSDRITGLIPTNAVLPIHVGSSIAPNLQICKIADRWGYATGYILTRPLGASFGDLLSQPTEYGGLGFGPIITSALFLAAIAGIVVYMSVTHAGDELTAV